MQVRQQYRVYHWQIPLIRFLYISTALSAAIPSTAVITGAELVVDYSLQVLSRSKDKDVDVEVEGYIVTKDIV